VVNLALQIQQTGLHLDEERKIDIFFPPVRLDSYQSACLEMNLAALVYFEVKLVYATPANNDYKERLMFRSIESLGKELRLWKTTITPDMTEGHEFVVVLHSKSSSLGTMAIIDNIKLHMSVCNAAGENVCFLLLLPVRLFWPWFVCLSVCIMCMSVRRITQKVLREFL